MHELVVTPVIPNIVTLAFTGLSIKTMEIEEACRCV
jgi:hypothetical protein